MDSDHVLYIFKALIFLIYFNILLDGFAIFVLLWQIAKHLKESVTTKKNGKESPPPYDCQTTENQNEPAADSENTNEIIEINNQLQTRTTQKDKKAIQHYGVEDMTNQIFGSIITLTITICDMACSIFLAYGLFNGKMNIVAVWLWIFPIVCLAGIIWVIKEKNLKEDKGACYQCCTITIINVVYFVLVIVYYFNPM